MLVVAAFVVLVVVLVAVVVLLVVDVVLNAPRVMIAALLRPRHALIRTEQAGLASSKTSDFHIPLSICPRLGSPLSS
eukprot:347467-Chlamydomonas_euryale.AAC.2